MRQTDAGARNGPAIEEGTVAPDILRELYRDLSRASPARLAFTRQAFQMLPQLADPRILDIGCGQGGPTLELARLSGGQVTGLDIDQSALHELATRASAEGLSDRIHAVHGSMSDIELADASFDIVWSEGSIHILGFERALREWYRLIRPRGFLVAHDMAWLQPDPPAEIVDCPQLAYPGMKTLSEYVALIPDHGYDLVGHFVVPADFWWVDYFVPMMARIGELRTKYADDQAAQEVLDREQRAAELFQAYSAWYSSVFLVMQRGAL
jgi:ubiquinone/menaquinone biosynthesis C-methylase UbiE